MDPLMDPLIYPLLSPLHRTSPTYFALLTHGMMCNTKHGGAPCLSGKQAHVIRELYLTCFQTCEHH